MAKYTIKNRISGDRRVNCRVLNESAGDYIVQFDDKSIKRVPMDRVDSLNRIDEGVLDRVRELGGKVLNGLKRLGKWIVSQFNDRVSIPANAYGYSDMEGYAFSGSDSLKSVAEEVGMEAEDFDNNNGEPDDLGYDVNKVLSDVVNFIKKYEVPEPKEDEAYESHRSPYRRVNAVNEANALTDKYFTRRMVGDPETFQAGHTYTKPLKKTQGDKKAGELVTLTRSDPFDLKQKASGIVPAKRSTILEALSRLAERFILGGKEVKGLKSYICIWGAPGVGKTDIVYQLYKHFSSLYPNLTMQEVNVSKLQAWDVALYTPGAEDAETGVSRIHASYQPWLPVYTPARIVRNLPPERREECNRLVEAKKIDKREYLENYNEMLDNLCNGGTGYIDTETGEYVETERGAGGIIFFDEFSRINPKVTNTIMKILSDRVVDSAKLGSRWFFVLAANRLADLKGLARDSQTANTNEEFTMDQAMIDRVNSYEYIPDFEEWAVYMKKSYNTPDDILQFLRERPLLWLQNPAEDEYMPTPLEIGKDANNGMILRIGNPRNWTQAINDILSYMRGEKRYDKSSENIKKVFNILQSYNIMGLEEYCMSEDEMFGDISDYRERKDAERKYKRNKAMISDMLRNGKLEITDPATNKPVTFEFDPIEPATVYNFYVSKVSQKKDTTSNSDWKNMDPEALTDIVNATAGATAAANLVYFADESKRFTSKDAKEVLELDFTVYERNDKNEIVSTAEKRPYTTPSDMAVKSITPMTASKIAGYLVDEYNNMYSAAPADKREKMHNMKNSEEFFNMLAFIVVLENMRKTVEDANGKSIEASIFTPNVITSMLAKIQSGLTNSNNKYTNIPSVSDMEACLNIMKSETMTDAKIRKDIYGIGDDGRHLTFKNDEGKMAPITPKAALQGALFKN